ncbi:MAG TPA: hypothetical protein VGE18_03465 [Candidatus Paceibacterota bacterium]
MKASSTLFATFRSLVVGFVAGLLLLIVWELRENATLLLFAVTLMGLAWYLNTKIAHHFHGHHHHSGDSALDAVTPAVLILANILHPAVDGFSFYQTLSNNGAAAALVVGGGIVVHEILRQSALIVAFRFVGIRWHTIVVTALLGITGGIGLGILESTVVEKYESIADLATIFAYAFVISEYSIHQHKTSKGKQVAFLLAGAIIAGVLHFFLSAH